MEFLFCPRGLFLLYLSLILLVRLYPILFEFHISTGTWKKWNTAREEQNDRMARKSFCETGLQEKAPNLRLFSLEKKSLRSNLIVFKHMKGS